jgi:hypothetical protein
MDRVVQENTTQTQQLSDTAQAMAEQGRQLEALVGRFNVGEQTPPQAEISRDLADSDEQPTVANPPSTFKRQDVPVRRVPRPAGSHRAMPSATNRE